jgi:hypothetical protein
MKGWKCMSSYLGEISIVNDKYVNYKPYYRYENGDFLPLSKSDRQTLLPNSELENINFYSSIPDNPPEKLFRNHEYRLFNFELDDLEDNLHFSGERNRTGYKIDVYKLHLNP